MSVFIASLSLGSRGHSALWMKMNLVQLWSLPLSYWSILVVSIHAFTGTTKVCLIILLVTSQTHQQDKLTYHTTMAMSAGAANVCRSHVQVISWGICFPMPDLFFWSYYLLVYLCCCDHIFFHFFYY